MEFPIGNGQLRICGLFFDIATKWQLGDRREALGARHLARAGTGLGWNGLNRAIPPSPPAKPVLISPPMCAYLRVSAAKCA